MKKLKEWDKVLKKSINTGAVFVEQELGRELFLKYSKRFGFTQLTGIDLVGETYSRNENACWLFIWR